MVLYDGPVPEGAGPFRLVEPLGILAGAEAAAGVAAGAALWLAGGPLAFTLVRVDGAVAPALGAPAQWASGVAGLCEPAPDWAGLGPGPLVMGILNVTPDSFSDGGRFVDTAAAIAAGERMLVQGVDVLDVGGESTRPGSEGVGEEVEQARVLPVIEALARAGAVISVDTRNAATMRLAVERGARIVNDVSGLLHDPAALAMVALLRCPVILMHMRGTPATMNSLACYGDVVGEVYAELTVRAAAAEAAGVSREAIAIDPGFGFAKDAGQNLELMRRLPALLGMGRPIAAGISRKATIGMLSGETDAARRGPGSVAAALFALSHGARIVRVHDVAETIQAVRVWRGVVG